MAATNQTYSTQADFGNRGQTGFKGHQLSLLWSSSYGTALGPTVLVGVMSQTPGFDGRLLESAVAGQLPDSLCSRGNSSHDRLVRWRCLGSHYSSRSCLKLAHWGLPVFCRYQSLFLFKITRVVSVFCTESWWVYLLPRLLWSSSEIFFI